MRKLYASLTGFVFVLATLVSHAKMRTPDVANFTFTINATTGNVVFTNTSTIGNEPGERHAIWTFGDGTSQTTGPLAGTEHHYQSSGVYTVCLKIIRVSSNTGDSILSAQICKVVTIESVCQANFETVSATVNALEKYFVAQPLHSQNKKPVRICWTFGDNSDTCIQYATSFTGTYGVHHVYSHSGNYNVCVNILYDGGCEAHSCHTIHAGSEDSCRANFERIPFTSTNDIFTAGFRALPWHSNNKKPARICWSFGDGTDTCVNYGQDYNGNYVISHTYHQSGQYQVCINILYYGGCEAHTCKSITIMTGGCTANVFEITQSNNTLERNFYAAVTSIPPHPVERICWNFGDGSDTCIVSATASTPPPLSIHHVFPGPGVYHVCVRVLLQGGCVAENCKEIEIRHPNDLCGGYMTDSIVGPRTFRFKGFAIHRPDDPVVGYHWTFGDGTSGNGPEVTHTYNNGGEYRVCLLINTQSGCETRICNTIRVAGNNQTGLVLSPNPVINILHALFFSTHNETVNIRIVNATGLIVRTYTRTAVVGANNWEFDVSGLPAGPYLFTIQSPNQLASALFLKQ